MGLDPLFLRQWNADLIKSINKKDGLSYGTRLIVTDLGLRMSNTNTKHVSDKISAEQKLISPAQYKSRTMQVHSSISKLLIQNKSLRSI